MKIIDRYIIRNFVFAYVTCLAIMVCLYIMIDLMVNLDEFTKMGESIPRVVRNILNYYGYNLFLYFSQLAGTITVTAALITVGLMLRSNELTALLSSGVSMYRVAAPLMVLAICSHALWILDHEIVIPRIKHQLARKRDDMSGLKTLDVWFYRAGRPDGGTDLISGRFIQNKGRLENMIVIERDRDGLLQSAIRADAAQWNPQSQQWDLTRGRRESGLTASGGAAAPTAGKLKIESLAAYPAHARPEHLLIRQSQQWFAFLSLRELEQLEAKGDLVNPSTVIRSKHARFTAPLTNILLVVLTLPWFLTCVPNTVIQCASKALAMFVFALVFSVVCINAGPPGKEALFCWLPIILLTPVAVFVVDAIKT